MLDSLRDFADRVLGLHLQSHDLTFGHMAARSLVVFCFAVLLTRFADRRFLGRNAGYDWTLGVVLGSVLSRAVNGQASFWPTLGASAVLVLLHHLLSKAAFHSHWVSVAAKGRPAILIRNGEVNQPALRSNNITEDDLDENLRVNGGITLRDGAAEARLERNGMISVVKSKSAGG